MKGATETEIKLRVEDVPEITARLRSAGFQMSRPRLFEANTVYDTEDNRLTKAGMLLRLRLEDGQGIVTWKGPAIPGVHKSRPEQETTVGSLETFGAILNNLGYRPVFRYEKFRTEFRRPGEAGVIVLDETPIGAFLELEGEGDWIDKIAQILGFNQEEYILDSYGTLYRKFCESRRLEAANMVFASGEIAR